MTYPELRRKDLNSGQWIPKLCLFTFICLLALLSSSPLLMFDNLLEQHTELRETGLTGTDLL